MYDEMMEQPDSLRKTFESEMSKLNDVSKLVSKVDKVYLIGCGSSISTCYTIRDAIRMSSTNINIEVFTGYEFFYNKKLTKGENSIAIFASQSGETADTLASLRKANDYEINTVSISNEKDSSNSNSASVSIGTRPSLYKFCHIVSASIAPALVKLTFLSSRVLMVPPAE